MNKNNKMKDAFMLPLRDRHFNRVWRGSMHYFFDNTEDRTNEENKYSGWIKCKLVHLPEYSIITPDLVFFETDFLTFIQPLHFTPNQLIRTDTEIHCQIVIDISCSQTLFLRFSTNDFVRQYKDGSELFKCEIIGTERLEEYVTGLAFWNKEHEPQLLLYHHTSEENKEEILKSGYFKPSTWNIQGTKKLKNIGYAYLTCLPKLDCDACLQQIAMSSDGEYHMNVDEPPDYHPIFQNTDLSKVEKEKLTINVYRENTKNRTHTLDFFVNAVSLSPNHLIRHHAPDTHQVWYEVISAFIYRIGIEPSKILHFDKKNMIFDYENLKQFEYIIVGNGWNLKGLEAPFDEENTGFLAKIERIPQDSNILKFWFDNPNSNRFGFLDPDLTKF